MSDDIVKAKRECVLCKKEFQSGGFPMHIRGHKMKLITYHLNFISPPKHCGNKNCSNFASYYGPDSGFRSSCGSEECTRLLCNTLSIGHYTNMGMSEEEARIIISDIQKKNSKKWSDKLKTYDDETRDKIFNTRVGYYMNMGLSKDEALKVLKERQTTFSLDKCISKYGEDEGVVVWKTRQDKWQNTLTSKSPEEYESIQKKKIVNIHTYTKKYGDEVGRRLYKDLCDLKTKILMDNFNVNNSGRSSKIEGRFLDEVEEHLGNPIDRQFRIIDSSRNIFVDGLYNNIVIEIFGDYWHGNPTIYSESDTITKKGYICKDIWDMDKKRFDIIESKGFNIIVVWESSISSPNKMKTTSKLIAEKLNDPDAFKDCRLIQIT